MAKQAKPAKKKVKAPAKAAGLLRGVALVEAALAVRRQDNELNGMSAKEIAAIDLEEEYYGFVPTVYEPARQALAKKCFGGYVAHIEGSFSKHLS